MEEASERETGPQIKYFSFWNQSLRKIKKIISISPRPSWISCRKAAFLRKGKDVPQGLRRGLGWLIGC
jgi:hypothetical protein